MPDERPNFILIFPDQWRSDCLGLLHPVVETPNLDHLADQGVLFTSAYSACPSCIASRACLATGQTPSTCGRIGYRDRVPWRYPTTLMSVLRAGGYQTINVGKTHFYPQRARLGFEESYLYDPQMLEAGFESDYHTWLREVSDGLVTDTALDRDNNSWLAVPWPHPEYLHPTNWTTTTAIERIERRDPQRPFFLQVGYHRPHPPLDPPPHYLDLYRDVELPPVPVGDWAERFDHPTRRLHATEGRLADRFLDRARRAYYALVTHLDHQIGRLLYSLQRLGALRNTWVIFTSDHGELLGDHHLFRKTTPHEGSAGIPLIIQPPEGGEARRCKQPVTHMDLMPTLLEIAGLEIQESVEGHSLLPLIRGENVSWRKFVHGEHSPCPYGWQFVTDGREKYVWETTSGQEWFFDLQEDRQERFDRSRDPAYAERVSLWRQRLVEILAQRPADGLTDGERLIPGSLPPVRDWVLGAEEGCA